MTTTESLKKFRRPQFDARRLLAHAALIVGALVMIYPLLWMLASSLKPEDQIFTDLSLIPKELVLSNYVEGWSAAGQSFGRYFINSLIVCVGAVAGNLIACSMAAYAFARLDFRFKRVWFALMLLTIMLPQHVTLIPQYAIFLGLDWVNTYLPLIVPKFLATDAFFIFLMVQFIRGLPADLDDAAKVDGCTPFGVYWRIILPLLVPALTTTAIFTFLWTYDDFFSQLIYLSDTALFTVPLGLRLFLDSTGESSWGPMFAMSVVSLLPTFAFFLLFQRWLVEGISTTGLKG
jgi:pectin-derived oligosaccharide transport system permease protein